MKRGCYDKNTSVQRNDEMRRAGKCRFALFSVGALFSHREERHMETPQLLELLAAGPVIAAVKDDEGLAAALESDVAVLLLLYGDVLTIGETVARCHDKGKKVFVHLDLIDGLAAR